MPLILLFLEPTEFSEVNDSMEATESLDLMLYLIMLDLVGFK